jgi:hypothetical protein
VTGRPPTLLEAIQERTGSLRATMKVGMTITCWAIVRQDLGRAPFVHEYADWWKVSERTAWREMAGFAKAFPDEENPDRLAQLVIEAVEYRRLAKRDAAVVLATPLALA